MDERRRRIRIRAWRRGLREMDLILGGFADSRIASLDHDALVAFEALLDLPDQDVYDWLIGREEPPASLAALVRLIRQTPPATTRPE